MRVVITGSKGFTGYHLQQYLQQYNFITIKCDREECDISNTHAIENFLAKSNPDAIIHLAGVSFTAYDNKEPYYRINTIGTHNLLEASQKVGVKKVIIASSAAVYGKQESVILHENLCPNPQNHYALSKYCAEKVAMPFFNKMEVIITRPFNYTGERQKGIFVIPKIIYHFYKKEPLILGNIDTLREYNDIKFVCEAYKRLLEKDVGSTIVNIASGRGLSLREIIKHMERMQGKIPIKIDPTLIRPNEPERLIGSPQKLFELVGRIEQPPIEKTLERMLNNLSC